MSNHMVLFRAAMTRKGELAISSGGRPYPIRFEPVQLPAGHAK